MIAARLTSIALLAASLALAGPAAAQQAPAETPAAAKPAALPFKFGVLRQFPPPPPWWNTIATLPPQDDGIAGARLGIADNNTTGRFMKQDFQLAEELVPFGEDPLPAFNRLIEGGAKFIVLAVPADQLLKMADAAKGKDVILFNAGAPDDELRQQDCRANVLHTAPNRAMLTDALAQYLVTRRWSNWLLLTGRTPEDRKYADDVKRSAKKFGAKIVEERVWNFGPDARATAQNEVPVFTQNVSYDIAVIADELGEFGDLIGWRTWDPRPTAGTAGLTPTTWHSTLENWGAAQLQNRFYRQSKRVMRPLDFQMWLAMRTIGEAGTRTKSNDVKALRGYIFGPDFELAGFKGQSFTYRPWDNQLRQPIVLAQPAAVVTVSPQEGFLHQTNLLDTMGFDRPETKCKLQ
ncbi:ABC transporter substrate-binding protein [Methylopila turkensis]|uniref:ABC transporter substrate-binding protein n=1 Tax=Methylopila turkensis TaxID=1437816 RepID=A0A9W6N7S0_9HYPH|nr:ABC transporter substrate-binding protein [Methylopila turkensis]GLK80710.1 ABC transporter substrate-binding protein [Methylopila turkensis]